MERMKYPQRLPFATLVKSTLGINSSYTNKSYMLFFRYDILFGWHTLYRSRCDVALLETQTRGRSRCYFYLTQIRLYVGGIEAVESTCRALGPRGFVYTWITCVFREGGCSKVKFGIGF
jgi:hypothetical protein